MTWLVDEEAVEGVECEIETLVDFWRLTSEQDWTICEPQAKGVRSTAFDPGPLSTAREANVDRLPSWYVDRIVSGSASAP